METAFSKIVSDMDGRSHILIEGRIVSLRISDKDANNQMVQTFVTALRRGGGETLVMGGLSRSMVGGVAPDNSAQTII